MNNEPDLFGGPVDANDAAEHAELIQGPQVDNQAIADIVWERLEAGLRIVARLGNFVLLGFPEEPEQTEAQMKTEEEQSTAQAACFEH